MHQILSLSYNQYKSYCIYMWIHTCKVKCSHRPNGNYVNNLGFYQIHSYSYKKQLWSQYNNQDILIYSVSFKIKRLLSMLLISFVCYSSCQHTKADLLKWIQCLEPHNQSHGTESYDYLLENLSFNCISTRALFVQGEGRLDVYSALESNSSALSDKHRMTIVP